MKVLVIIITYNAMNWIDKCLSSVQNSSCDADLYIVDNASSDDSVAYIKEHYPEAILVESKENLGFGKANNLGLQYATNKDYDYVYLLNQDAWLEENTLEVLIEAQKRSKAGIISPLQYQADLENLDKQFAKRISCCTSLSTCWSSLSRPITQTLVERSRDQLTSIRFATQSPSHGGRACRDQSLTIDLDKDTLSLPYIMAAHWLISKECLLKVGGFSPVFPHYGEDENYCERVLYHGLDIAISTQARAVHDRGERKDNKAIKIYRNYYTKTLARLSSPNKKIYCPVLYALFFAFAYSLRYLSFTPFTYTKKILSSLKQIKENLKLSKQDCAYLSKNS